MKKFVSMVMVVTMLIGIMSLSASAIISVRVVLDGTLLKFPDAQPFLNEEDNRVQVPARIISEALGAEVNWDEAKQVVTITKGSDVIILKIGEKAITVNGEAHELDTAAMLKSNRTFVPVRFVSEYLGATVKWDKTLLTVEINKPNSNLPETKNISGYIVPVNTGSDLRVDEGGYYSHNKDKEYSEISMVISYFDGEDVEKQLSEAEAILLQKMEPEVVAEAMEYVRTKKSISDYLAIKNFEGKDRKISIGGNISTAIYVYFK